MFIIEKLIQDHRDRVEIWEHARDRWIAKQDYYSRGEYEDRNPSPGDRAKSLLCLVGISFVAAAVFSCIATAVVHRHNYNMQHPKQHVAIVAHASGDNCKKFNIDDHVRIQYGDYQGDNGRIIGGCNGGEDYQVKIDNGMKADVYGDGVDGPVDVGNRTISVSSGDNLVVIKE